MAPSAASVTTATGRFWPPIGIQVSSSIATRTGPAGSRACIRAPSSCRSRHTLTWSTCTPSGARACLHPPVAQPQAVQQDQMGPQPPRAALGIHPFGRHGHGVAAGLAAIPPHGHGAVAAQIGHRARDRAVWPRMVYRGRGSVHPPCCATIGSTGWRFHRSQPLGRSDPGRSCRRTQQSTQPLVAVTVTLGVMTPLYRSTKSGTAMGGQD